MSGSTCRASYLLYKDTWEGGGVAEEHACHTRQELVIVGLPPSGHCAQSCGERIGNPPYCVPGLPVGPVSAKVGYGSSGPSLPDASQPIHLHLELCTVKQRAEVLSKMLI